MRYYSNRYLTIIHDSNDGCVTVSDNKPAYDRLDSIKLVEIWEVIAFQKNKRNMNIDDISNAKLIY
jgi:hypothetical protein